MNDTISKQKFDWMVKATPQLEWIDQQGIYLWLAFFFSEVGAGVYFLSLFLDFRAGLIIGWLMTLVLGGLVHLQYLGKPDRAWRMLLKPKHSELARGMWVILLFAVFGFLQIIPGVFSSLPWTGYSFFLKVFTGLLSLLIIMHGFATMNVMKALPAWNSSTVLPLSIISGILTGSQILEFVLCFTEYDVAKFEVWSVLFLFVYFVCITFYVLGTYHSSDTARKSIVQMLTGDDKKYFIVGVVVVGLAVPALLSLFLWGSSAGFMFKFLVFVRLLFILVGDLMMRFTIMKNAYYVPLI